MNATYTAVVKQDNGWWLGWIEEVPGVNCQEKTRQQLIETLKVTLREALEFNRNEGCTFRNRSQTQRVSFPGGRHLLSGASGFGAPRRLSRLGRSGRQVSRLFRRRPDRQRRPRQSEGQRSDHRSS